MPAGRHEGQAALAWDRAALAGLICQLTGVIAACELIRDLAREQAAEAMAGLRPGTLRLLDGIAEAAEPLEDAFDLAYELSMPADQCCGMCDRPVGPTDAGTGWQHSLVSVAPGGQVVAVEVPDGHTVRPLTRPRLRPAVIDGQISPAGTGA